MSLLSLTEDTEGNDPHLMLQFLWLQVKCIHKMPSLEIEKKPLQTHSKCLRNVGIEGIT